MKASFSFDVFIKKTCTLFKFGIARNVEHCGDSIQLKKLNKKHLELKTWYFRL